MAYTDLEKARAYRSQWQKDHKENRRISGRRYYDKKKADPEWMAANRELARLRRVQNGSNPAYQRQYRKANPDRHAIYEIRNRYKVSLEEAASLLERKKNGCEICGSKNKPSIDHDHSTGMIRGILCSGCNLAVGHANENPTILRALADYIEKAGRYSPSGPNSQQL
jgi:hypothetical protein